MGAQKVITFPVAPHNRHAAVPHFEDLQSFGEYLRAHRERRRITLAQIARDTKLIVSRLEGLERGHVDPLPPGIYRRALVRAYALAVGLDPEEMVAEFQKLTVLETGAPEPALPAPEQVQPKVATRSRRLPQALGSIAAGIAVGALALTMNQWSAAPSAAPTSAGAVATTSQQELAGADVQLASQEIDNPAVVSQDVTEPATEAVVAPQPVVDPVPAPTAADNTLRITSYPAGARVTINGIGWGSTPLAIPHLPPGDKVVRLTRDGFSSAETTVTLADNRPASVSLTLQASEIR